MTYYEILVHILATAGTVAGTVFILVLVVVAVYALYRAVNE